MKKIGIASLMLAIMFVLSSFAVFAEYDLNAYPYDEARAENRVPAKANNGTPALDGNISAGEGWGDAVTFDHTNMAGFWNPSSRCIIDANVSFAWNEDGLYVAADITDPHMIPSTGEDTVDNDEGTNDYGWDGDVFIFAIDPAKAFLDAGMVGKGERSAWYCISVSEANELMCYASSIGNNSGDVTSNIEGAAKLTSGGWAFEIMIPWTLIDEHTMVASGGSASIDDRITTPGTKSNVGIMYMNRAMADGEVDIFHNGEVLEAGQVFTVARSICVPIQHDDGMPWHDGGESIRSYGVELSVADASGVVPEIEENDAPDETDPAVDEPEETDEDAPAVDETEDKADETEPEEIIDSEEESTAPLDTALTLNNDKGDDDGSNIGLIIGIIAGVVVVAAIVVVVIMMKKKKAQ